MAYIGKTPASAALTSGDISDGIITSAKIANGGVETVDIADSNITAAKIASGVIPSASKPFKNIIINGDMSIAQRGTSFTSNGYGLDRFVFDENSDAAVTVTQDSDVPSGQGFTKSLKVDVTTADTSIAANQSCGVTQYIEGQNLQYLKYGTSSAENLTLSFWVKSVKTGIYCVRFVKESGGQTRYETPIEYTVSQANTWEKKTITLSPTAGSTTLITNSAGAIVNSNVSGFRIMFTLAAGSNFHATNNTWVAGSDKFSTSNQVNFVDSTSNNFYITGIQLEVGTAASDFEFLPVDVNTTRCFRYYQKTFEYSQAPVDNAQKFEYHSITPFSAGNMAGLISYYSVEMRATPTVTVYTSGQSANGTGKISFYQGSAWLNAAVTVQSGSTTKSVHLTGGSLSNIVLAQFNYEASAEL